MNFVLPPRVLGRLRNQAGLSVLEYTLWVVVASAVSLMAFRAASEMMDEGAVVGSYRQIKALSDAVVERHADGVSRFSGLTIARLRTSGIVPTSLHHPTSASLLALPIGTFTTSATPANVGADGFQFAVTMPRKYCPDFVGLAAKDFELIRIGDTYYKNNLTSDSSISVADTGACAVNQAVSAGTRNVVVHVGRIVR